MEIQNVRKQLTNQQAVLADNSDYQKLLSELEKEKLNFQIS